MKKRFIDSPHWKLQKDLGPINKMCGKTFELIKEINNILPKDFTVSAEWSWNRYEDDWGLTLYLHQNDKKTGTFCHIMRLAPSIFLAKHLMASYNHTKSTKPAQGESDE